MFPQNLLSSFMWTPETGVVSFGRSDVSTSCGIAVQDVLSIGSTLLFFHSCCMLVNACEHVEAFAA